MALDEAWLLPGEIPDGLAEVLRRPAWHAQAACRGSDASFFPERGEPTAPAKAVCRTCPVVEPCLQAGVDGVEDGVWGGSRAGAPDA